MGSKIVRELVALGSVTVRASHRAISDPDQVAHLAEAGASLVGTDLSDEASLSRACEGIDVVVSAVQGPREAIVEGQTRLLRAAESAGVARMIPSDFSLDFFKTAEGGNRNLDLRREFNRVLDGSSVRGTSVLCGAFMDLLVAGRMGPDPKTGAFRIWGDGNQAFDFTTTDDVARYVAAVAVDAEAGRVVRVAGDSLTQRELAAVFEEVRGVPVKIERAGSLDDLERLIAKLRAEDQAPTNVYPAWQQLQYARDMAAGRGKLEPLDNDRYPAIRPQTVRGFLRT
jgi:uncharacterized protein YbjT (DUF2867 family)